MSELEEDFFGGIIEGRSGWERQVVAEVAGLMNERERERERERDGAREERRFADG